MERPEFDIIVYDRKGNTLAVVETKSYRIGGNDRTSFYYYRRACKLAEGYDAKYYALITPNKAHFWKVGESKKPAATINEFSKILERYRKDDLPTDLINHDYLQALVWRWFLDLAKGKESDPAIIYLLKKIAFYNKILKGDAELEIAA